MMATSRRNHRSHVKNDDQIEATLGHDEPNLLAYLTIRTSFKMRSVYGKCVLS